MNIENLKEYYRDHADTHLISDKLNEAEITLHVKGLVGSADALVSTGVFQRHGGTHLFIMTDKEEAAYFFNDLESINQKDAKILFFPGAYRRPYQVEDTDNANVLLRAEVLNEVTRRTKRTIIVTYPAALTEKVVTKQHLAKNTLELKLGGSYSIDFVNELLFEYEFERVDYVHHPGQFSIRGGIVDVFSFSNEHPYRIEFFGDDVDSIRSFDPVTQLSIKKMSRIDIVPNVQQKLLQEARQTFLEYIPTQTVIWIKDFEFSVAQLKKEFEKVETVYDKLESPLLHLKPADLYNSEDNFERNIKNFSRIEFGTRFSFTADTTVQYIMTPQPNFNKNFELLIENLQTRTSDQYLNFIAAGNPKQIERLDRIFEDMEAEVKFHPVNMALHEGFIDKQMKVLCYTDHQIFERYHRFRLKEGFKRTQEAITLKDLHNLKKGDFVTHIDFGVGQFSGLEKIDNNGKVQEAIRLIYKNKDVLYVSIHSLHRIAKYSGKDGTQPTLHKLGSPQWATLKQKAKKKVKELAFDLIQLYAKRKAQKGFAYTPDTYLQNELEASFIYEDTPDQLKATQAVKKDMEGDAPMDRLVCGDVGFGKTEIAIRAAFKAVADSKQVAVLAPTTILTLQHFKTFRDRLADMPCRVEYINRFRSRGTINAVLKDVKEGRVDILIGTHRLVGKDVEFKDLGLMIIDEEQKFGVSVKDKLKTMKVNVDALTMTATPIPRTLQFSMLGARDLSIINTAPPNRQPVQTIHNTFSEELIRDGIIYETSRGGQVFFVHNRVQNIQEVAGMIQRLCPSVRVGVGHGQMDGKKLEELMVDFMDGLYDVLVATTIIESGIDIPNANTIYINQAQNFGMSDLHQLRGRVGRSNKKAFCYLLSPSLDVLPDESRKRLQTIVQFSELGSGFNIAMRDLDIRGAGNLLGGEQSGFISDIGFEMYQKILEEAVRELKENEFRDLFEAEQVDTQNFVGDVHLETDLELLIPDDYVNQIAERLALYRELDDVEGDEKLDAFQTNLVDRFGPLPKQAKNLLNTVRLRWKAKDIGFERVILKKGVLIGGFVVRKDSPYYQSAKFTRVLDFIKKDPLIATMSEKNEKLRMIWRDVSNIDAATKAFDGILAIPLSTEEGVN